MVKSLFSRQLTFKSYMRPLDDLSDPLMPREFRLELNQIKAWAQDNDKDARRDRFAFWFLKIPAMVVSATAAVLAHFKLDDLAMIAAAVATFCILIDGLRPRGLLYSTHLRAASEVYRLYGDMLSQWRTGRLNDRDPRTLAAEIIAQAQPERTRISIYLTHIESSSVQERPPMA